jgi:hypothetical protein
VYLNALNAKTPAGTKVQTLTQKQVQKYKY